LEDLPKVVVAQWGLLDDHSRRRLELDEFCCQLLEGAGHALHLAEQLLVLLLQRYGLPPLSLRGFALWIGMILIDLRVA
jgi:hypothetical protein